jgi:arginine deiminase
MICIHVYYDTFFQVQDMKGKHEHVRGAMEQSDARINYLEEELGESNKKVHSNLPFVCEQTFLFVVHVLEHLHFCTVHLKLLHPPVLTCT